MKIALIGFGSMGKLIRTLGDGHDVAVVVDDADAGLSAADLAEKLSGVDVAIDFTIADAVKRNVEGCVLAGVPLVEGTTGWNDERAIRKIASGLPGSEQTATNRKTRSCHDDEARRGR